jgi:hypothetical protein
MNSLKAPLIIIRNLPQMRTGIPVLQQHTYSNDPIAFSNSTATAWNLADKICTIAYFYVRADILETELACLITGEIYLL